MTTMITVVGLGSGDEDQLSLGIWKRLQTADHVYVRTAAHPAISLLQRNGIAFESFDYLYEQKDTFPEVYEAIVAELIIAAKKSDQGLIYAVPGHPMVAESTVQLLISRCAEAGVELKLLGGESFLDQAFLRLGLDPIEGFQLLDGTAFQHEQVHPRLHTIIAQVYDPLIASDVKLGLMEIYPDDYPVVVAHALGLEGEERIETIPLYELDRVQGYGNLSLVWIPADQHDQLQRRLFSHLREVVRMLRSPQGCPWDRAQTHSSIRRNLIEETYEVLETIDDDDPQAMCEELGDLLLQIMLHSQMEEEAGTFTIYDVIAVLNDKLVRRHPHVFESTEGVTVGEALQSWNDVKQQEKRDKGIDVDSISVLSGVPRDLPGLLKAEQLQRKAAKVGFDWERIEGVFAKIVEELEELQEVAFSADQEQQQQAELGDLLFAVVNAARFLNIDPEEAIAATNRKFMQRFAYIEQQLRLRGQDFAQTSLREMDQWWDEAKHYEKNKER